MRYTTFVKQRVVAFQRGSKFAITQPVEYS